jgi:NAD(P)-dependent dehydrogenase (short-subunit alcohol dehydrogenase family)
MILKDKVILVTGSSTGIGRAIARRCVAEGARVMYHGLDEAETAAAARETVQVYTSLDLAEPGSAERLIAETVQRLGRIDGLVNNAASTARGDIAATTAVFFDYVMAINLRAPLLLIRAALPHFRAQGSGVVVNVGSVNAYCGEAELLAYSISKGGLMTLTRNLADALARENVRVNQINPGWTLSENEIALQIQRGMPADWYRNVPPEFAPSGRLMSTDEVAAHALHWLSPASHPVSGAVHEVEQFPTIGRNPYKPVERTE